MLLVELAPPSLGIELAPGLLKEREQLLVYLDVVSVALALIPDNATDGQMSERRDGCFEEVGGFVRMALERIVCSRLFVEGVGDVLRHAASCPSLSEVAVAPVVQDVGKLPFQRRAVNP